MTWKPTKHEGRSLNRQLQQCHETLLAQHSSTPRCMVQEVFSPPRFTAEVSKHGLKGFSYDLVNGFDLSTRVDRIKVEQALLAHPPELLILCPPCTDEGGWFHLNSTKWERWEYLARVAKSRSFIKWCCKLFKQQVERGGRAMFEHPTGAKTWSYSEMQTLCRRYFTTKLHMCQYGLQLPGSDRFIRKSTRLLVSHEDMCSLGRLCSGSDKHECHDTVQGHWPDIPQVSTFAGAYPPEFVRAVLNTVPRYHERTQHACHAVNADELPPDKWEEVCAAAVLPPKPTKS